MTDELISQNAGKVLLHIYLKYKQENRIPHFQALVEQTKYDENQLMRALFYCSGKCFLSLNVKTMSNGKKIVRIDEITDKGIDIVEKPADESKEKPFNVTFNFYNEFNVESIIKGEAKLF